MANVEEFIEQELVPQGNVRIAAFDGENADPVNGRVQTQWYLLPLSGIWPSDLSHLV